MQFGVLDAAAGRKLRAVKRLGPAVVALREVVNERPGERWYLAQALVGLGDLHRGEATRALPRGSLKRVTDAMKRQASELETAQDFYIEAAQQMQPTWTAEATSHLAVGYLELSVRLLELRASPGRLSDFERQGLQSWIDAQRPGLDRKSRDAFRLCADVFTETGLNNPTTQVCREMLRPTEPVEDVVPITPDRSGSPSPEPR